MKLEGSCHCGAVRFCVESREPVPFCRCYCSICRKTAGGGGYAINLGGDNDSLEVEGREHLKVYRARIQNPEDDEPWQSEHERWFCRECGTHLWAWHPKWPDLVHPVASAIDTPLPAPPDTTHIMLDFKAPWVHLDLREGDQQHGRYPNESLAEWHRRHGF